MRTQMMLHPLHTAECVADYVRSTGEYFDVTRRTGRSTMQALRLLASAIESPRLPVPITDHRGTLQADRALMSMMKDMVDVLGLREMYFNLGNMTVTFGKV